MSTVYEQGLLGNLRRIYRRGADKERRDNAGAIDLAAEHEAGLLAVYRAASTDWVSSVQRPIVEGT